MPVDGTAVPKCSVACVPVDGQCCKLMETCAGNLML
jgi:hypothetical protein